MPPSNPRSTSGPGPAVDASGGPVVDPTANVRALVEAGMRRQDDLRVLVAEHNREVRNIVADYEEKLRLAETARINAIRQVDVDAVGRAAQVSSELAATLATQVAASAEALRTNVATVAAAFATSQAAALSPIIKAIEDLRQTQYEAQGQRSQRAEGKDTNQWLVMLVVTLLGIAVTWIVLHK